MFTPELVSEETGEFVLVGNHSLETAEAVAMSIAYHRGRIKYGKAHLPPHVSRCVVHYDIRGQNVPDTVLERLRHELDDSCEVRITQ